MDIIDFMFWGVVIAVALGFLSRWIAGDICDEQERRTRKRCTTYDSYPKLIDDRDDLTYL